MGTNSIVFRNWLTSWIRSANCFAFSSKRCPRKRSSYSLIPLLQPAALVMIAFKSCGNKSRLTSANSRARLASPVCILSDPQHPCPLGTKTSNPFAANTRIVAALISGAIACCTQPANSPTRPRHTPCAGVNSGIETECGSRLGMRPSIARSGAGNMPAKGLAILPNAAAHRNRVGNGKVRPAIFLATRSTIGRCLLSSE